MVTKTSFRVVFDRFLLPTTTFRQSVCLQPVLGLVRAAKDCAHGVALEPAYDPVERQIVYRQPATSAGLVPGTRYTFSVFPPDAGTTNGITAFDGAPLDDAVSRDFTTRAVEPAGTVVEPPPSVDYCATLDHDVFQAACATSGCHVSGAVDHGVTLGAAEGLDLAGAARLRATALGHVAHETQTGEHASAAEASPSRFGRAMPLLDPSRPGNSYLLYKLLANPANGAPGSDAAAEQGRLDELERLRSSVVVGLPMPPPDGRSAPITPQQLQAISDWILAGAKADCP